MKWIPVFLALALISAPAWAAPKTIELTQTGCQFLEPEQTDLKYHPKSAGDCNNINQATAESRIQKAEVLRMAPGSYLFRVTNKNVPYTLGFWLRGQGVSRLTLPSTSGGGIEAGEHQDYPIDLKKGTYLYSCPLNPTPDYLLVVE